MIQLPRSLAKKLRAVFRRCIPKNSSPEKPMVVFAAGEQGLRIRLIHSEIAVEYRQDGAYATEMAAIPLDALPEIGGRGDSPVTIEKTPDKVLIRWLDGGVPQVAGHEAGDMDTLPSFPDAPQELNPADGHLIIALKYAMQTADKESPRYAIHRIQVRGSLRQIVATDGAQLLVQDGFHFPWSEDVLIARTGVFGCKEVADEAPVEVGRTPGHVAIRMGAWSTFLAIDSQGRFPSAESVLPKAANCKTQCSIGPDDMAFLGRTLKRLPVEEDGNQPITVDLNGKVAIRARGNEPASVTELVLANSRISGQPVRFAVNRQHLQHAIRLGLSEFSIVNADSPILCQDKRRKLAVMTLSKQIAIPPTADAVSITSSEAETATADPEPGESAACADPSIAPPKNGVHEEVAPAPRTRKGGRKLNAAGLPALVEEAQSLKAYLREGFRRANQLISSIKRHRKQSKLLQSTLTSLRQLQNVDA